MRRTSITMTVSILALCLGCEPQATTLPAKPVDDAELAETLEQIEQDERIQRLREYGDQRMKRLLTKTGEGVKQIEWDLTEGNHISLVDWPSEESSDEYIINQEIELSIRFPAGFSVEERATLLICRRAGPESDRLHSISFHLPPCTTEEAYRITKNYIEQWKLKKQFTTDEALRALDQWRAKGEQAIGNTLLVARHANYPIIDVEILRSYDDEKPWYLSIYFSIEEPPLPAEVVDCFEAIRTGEVATATKLIDSGLDPNSQNVLHDSLLHQAAESGRLGLVKLLIKQGAQIDARGGYGQTPFWEAVLDGQLEVAQFLLDKGADIDSRERGTVLHYVAEYMTDPVANHELAQWLVDHGAKVDSVDNRGDTPLHKSAWKGHLEAAKVLISANANVNAVNHKGMTPLDNARNQHQTELEALLLKHDARTGVSIEGSE